MRQLVILAFLLTTTGPALSADWRLISAGKGVQIYLDLQSIAPNGPYWKAWFRWEYAVPRSITERSARSSKELAVFNCQERTTANAQIVFYEEPAAHGPIVYSDSAELGRLQFSKVKPETIGEAMLTAACRFQ